MELMWSWQEIVFALMWRLAPRGLVLFPYDLDLPRDRVLLEDRNAERIELTFITLKEAERRTHARRHEERATTDRLSGRWQQIAAVMLWKLRKSGITLTPKDKDAVPHGMELLTSGHPDGVEWRFIPKAEVLRMALRQELHQERTS